MMIEYIKPGVSYDGVFSGGIVNVEQVIEKQLIRAPRRTLHQVLISLLQTYYFGK